jgi:import inner membrane translocase subunit TIM22
MVVSLKGEQAKILEQSSCARDVGGSLFLKIVPLKLSTLSTTKEKMSGPMQAMMPPIYLPGQEPLPPGFTEQDRLQMQETKKWQAYMTTAMEGCPTKCLLSGGAGFALGGFFSLLSASLSVDDPLRRSNLAAAQLMASEKGLPPPPELTTAQQTKLFFKETGKGMYRSAKGFGKVGALYAGIECCIEGVSAFVLEYKNILSHIHYPSV